MRLSVVLAAHDEAERAALLGGDVVELEVANVDARRAEGLEDLGEDVRPVGHVDLDALEGARVAVGDVEHPAAVGGSLADPARDELAVAAAERGLDLLDPPAVLGEACADCVGIVEEHVDPHARVGARDSRHVAERAAGVRERLVPLDSGGAGLVDDDVREHVRDVARERDELVVGGRLDRMRERPELADEAVDEGVALRGSSRSSASETTSRPRRAPTRRGSAPCASLPAIGCPPTNRAEPPAAATTCALVEPVSVTVVSSPARLEHRRDLPGEHGHRSGDDCEVGAGDRLGQRAGGLDRVRARPPGRARRGPGPSR